MHLVLVVLVVLVLVGAASAGIVALLAVLRAARALRAGYRTTRAQVSERTVTTLNSLQARALPPGPRREVADLRRSLRRSREATDRLLADASGPLGHLPEWAQRLAQATDGLDRQLAGLQREPDTAHMSTALAALRPLAQEATTAGAELRAAIRQAGSAVATPGWTALTGGIRDEIQAVSAGIAYLRSETAHPLLRSTRR